MTEGEPVDLMAALIESVRKARLSDDLPCPKCGGDRLRTDFTDSGQCHARRKGQADD